MAMVLGVTLGLVAVAGFPAPGGSGATAGVSLVGARYYSYESVSVFGPAWSNYSYQGVTFSFHLWCSIAGDVGWVCGNATEWDRVSYPYAFSDGLPTPSPQWQTWVAPDYHEAVQYLQGGNVHLLVLDSMG